MFLLQPPQCKVPKQPRPNQTCSKLDVRQIICVSLAVALLPGSNATVLYGIWLIAEKGPMTGLLFIPIAHCR